MDDERGASSNRRRSGHAVRRSRQRRTAVAAVALVLAACASDGERDDGAAPPATASSTASPAPTESSAVPAPRETTVPPATSTLPGTTTDPQENAVPPYEFEIVSLPLVDDTRPTVPLSGEQVPSRSLPTTLYLPVTDEPVPLVVFSHGYGASPAKFDRLLGAWAVAGYAVAAPAFPLTSDLIEGPERALGDVVNQPADVVFVLDQVLAGEYAARIDPDRVAAAGLSLGGLTTYLAAVDVASRDSRFVAALVMAAVPPGESFVAHDMPILVMHGELDPVVPAATADAVLAGLTGPAYGVTMLGGFHAEPFEDEEENPAFPDRERFHPVVDATTTAFWDTYLLPDPSAEDGIAAAGDRPGITRFVGRTT